MYDTNILVPTTLRIECICRYSAVQATSTKQLPKLRGSERGKWRPSRKHKSYDCCTSSQFLVKNAGRRFPVNESYCYRVNRTTKVIMAVHMHYLVHVEGFVLFNRIKVWNFMFSVFCCGDRYSSFPV